MEKEKIISALKEKLGTTQLSERTINDYANGLATLADEVLTDEFLTAQVATLKSFEGQLNHDIAEKVEDWKKQHPAPETEPETNDKPDWFKQWEEEQNAKVTKLEGELNAYKSAEAKKVLLNALTKKLKEEIKAATGADANEYFVKNTLRDIEISEDSKLDDLVATARNSYDKNLKAAGLSADAPREGNGGQGGDTTDWSEEVARKKEQGKIPS